MLAQHVNFYRALTENEKSHFEKRVYEFLLNYKITGASVDIDLEDRLLIAASGIIPIFKFPQWRYSNLDEVIVYPDMFNHNFETTGQNRNILGMVGNGYMEGKMILSKKAIHLGFANETDKRNTAIHEFIHLIDKMDGVVDGIPKLLLEQPYIIPWLDMLKKKIADIHDQESDINPYGGTSEIEFFAVASEYFFERPKLLSKKHPELYALLEEIFDHDMDDRPLHKSFSKIGRNDDCPCQSGKKYKVCCGD